MQTLPPHQVLIEPVRDPDTRGSVAVSDAYKDAHVQLGWVLQVSDIMFEDIHPGDLAVWPAWKHSQSNTQQYVHWKKDPYFIREDDILFILEDW